MNSDGLNIIQADPISVFKIKKNDVISITGAGGKTSLMFRLASKLKERGSVLITTSTKIAIPTEGFDRLYTSYEDFKVETAIDHDHSVICLGEKVPGKNKLGSVGRDQLRQLIKAFDFCLIEADGSRRLPFKFWYDYEPVIYDFSTKVIGVLPLSVYGKRPDTEFIYNYEGYMEYMAQMDHMSQPAKSGDRVNVEIGARSYKKLIEYEGGLFKNFTRDRFVFLNQCDLDGGLDHALEIWKLLSGHCLNITFGSIKEDKYYQVERNDHEN